MAINFPNSPANGDTHVSGEKTFNYDAAKGVWNLEGNLKVALDITSTPPSSPSHGDLWMDETTGDMYTYFTDADSSQWIQVNGVGAVGDGGGSGGATVYADMAALIAATGMSNGDLALVTSSNQMYIYNGSSWFLIATVTNAAPSSISGVNSVYYLAKDGTPTVITAASTDPEGFDITWSYAVTSGSLGTTATVSQNENVFTITPGTNDPADVGTFELTFSVTDGLSTESAAATFTLVFVTEFADINGTLSESTYYSMPGSGYNMNCVALNPSGTKGLVGTAHSQNRIWTFECSTGWDFGTAVRTQTDSATSLSGGTNVGNGIKSMFVNPDGDKIWMQQAYSKDIWYNTMTTPWDASTMPGSWTLAYSPSYFEQSNANSEWGDTFFWHDEGYNFYTLQMAGTNSEYAVHWYTVSSQWDLSTKTYQGKQTFNAGSPSGAGIQTGFISNTGNKIIVLKTARSGDDKLVQLNLSTQFDPRTNDPGVTEFDLQSGNSWSNRNGIWPDWQGGNRFAWCQRGSHTIRTVAIT